MLKNFNLKSQISLAQFLVFIVVFSVVTPQVFSNARAQTVEELRARISSNEAELKKLDEEISRYRLEISKTRKASSSLKGELKKLELARSRLSSDINLTQNKIILTQKNIINLSNDIQIKEKEIDRDREAVSEAARRLNLADRKSFVEAMLASVSLSDFWVENENYSKLNRELEKRIGELKDNRGELEIKKITKETEKDNLSQFKTKLEDEKKIAETTSVEKDKLLKETQNKETNYQQLLADRLKKKKAVEEEMRQVEEKLRIVLNPKLLPKTGSGVLKWPFDDIKITQYFGNTDFATKNPGIYNGKGHNGIDLGAPVGTPTKSAENGTVIGVGDTDQTCPGASYGKWVLIRHNNGLTTLYAHLSLIKASEGQTVNAGEVIGYSGNTGYSTGPHLHFTVYASQGAQVGYLKSKVPGCGTYRLPIAPYNAYLNPLSYL